MRITCGLDKTVIELAAQCYGVSPARLIRSTGGHFTHVYEYARDGQAYILRITPPNEEVDVIAMEAILAWVDYLASRGALVSRPVMSINHRLIETVQVNDGRYIAVVFEKAPGLLAEKVPFDQWQDALYEKLGKTVGKIHAVSRGYIPSGGHLRRPNWDEVVNCFNPRELFGPSQDTVRQKKEAILRLVRSFPKDREGYGLIHGDLHCGNFFIELTTGTITVFDFDDCFYGWYVMDIAMNLFDFLVLFPGNDRHGFSRRFLTHYLKGYRSENTLNVYWLEQMPHFLKLLEIGVYAQVYQDTEAILNDPWVSTFMNGRKEKIENDIPYVDIDFEEISKVNPDSLT
jgi:Ser/Thr protein kinase RdoA (MazF antagonist)